MKENPFHEFWCCCMLHKLLSKQMGGLNDLPNLLFVCEYIEFIRNRFNMPDTKKEIKKKKQIMVEMEGRI